MRVSNRTKCCFVADADKDDTGRYKVEISNDSGTGTCDIPVKVKGECTLHCFVSLFYICLKRTFAMASYNIWET